MIHTISLSAALAVVLAIAAHGPVCAAGSAEMLQSFETAGSAGKPAKSAPADIKSKPRFGEGPVAFNRWLMQHMEFTGSLYDEGYEERAMISFTVTKNGKLKDPVSPVTSDPHFANEVMALFSEAPAWIPATKNGKPIEARITMEIGVRLVRSDDGKIRVEDVSTYTEVAKMPQFEGGGPKAFREWVKQRVVALPGVTDSVNRIFVRCIVEKDGSMSDISVSSVKNKALSKRIEQIIASAPAWTPAREGDQTVRIRASFPVYLTAEAEQKRTSDDEAYMIAETMPQFQGGSLMKFRAWVVSRLKYPEEALIQQIEGRVVLAFVIETDGTLTNISVVQSPHPMLTQAAVDVLKISPKWTPGNQDGKTVRVKYTLPLDFRTEPSVPVTNPDMFRRTEQDFPRQF